MNVTVADIKNVVLDMCDIIIKNEVYFCELDSVAGDGDFGMSLSKGFKEVKEQIDEIDISNPTTFLRGCSMIISEKCGGASGPIWGSAFRAAGVAVKDKDSLSLDDVASMFSAAVAGIQKRGGAQLGDKTLLDALIPASQALTDAAQSGKSICEAFDDAVKAANDGAEKTKEMVASKGRATYLGERSLGHPDAGAAAIGLLLTELTSN